MKIRILLVDDHTILRAGLKMMLNAQPDMDVIGEAHDGRQAIQESQRLHPDIVLMDITMPDTSGLEVASDLRRTGYSHPILIFTMHSSMRLTAETRNAGAQGYVLKSQAIHDLVRAIDILLAGGTFFGAPSPAIPARNPGLSF